MSFELHIATDLSLPIAAVTEKLAFLGRTGSGKTYAAQKLAEEMHRAGAQFVVLDPVGVWYGLRLDKDGKSPGLKIPVLGGLRGDIPLEPTAGALIANLVVDRGTSVILDVSQFESDADKARFAHAFAERFFFRKKASPSAVHVFVEECQEFVPQNPQREEARMLHAFTRLVKIGRNFGIGVSLISQRPQEVNKKVLNLTELLFAFQLTGPQERKTIQGWIAEKGIDEDIAGELPKLRVGHPHVWSPAWLQISKVAAIAAKTTFDASSTPKVGKQAAARELGSIDLEQLRTDMVQTIERAAADDPKELHKRIRELERQLAAKPTAPAPERVEVSVLTDKHVVSLHMATNDIASFIEKLQASTREIAEICRNAGMATRTGPAPASAATKLNVAAPRPASPLLHSATPVTLNGAGEKLPAAERKILTALAQYRTRTKQQLAVLTGYAIKGGGFNNAIGALRTKGYADGRDLLSITDAGEHALGRWDALPTGRELGEYWMQQLPKAERFILDVLLTAYPHAETKETIAHRTGYEASGGGFNNAIGRLRTLELITGTRADLRACDAFFQEG